MGREVLPVRRRRTTNQLTDHELVTLYQTLQGLDRDEVHQTLADHGTDIVEVIQARRRLRGVAFT